MRVYRDQDADPTLLASRRVAVIGYGNQGHAHALNLRDAGAGEVAVGVRPGSPAAARAEAAGFPVMTNARAGAWADIVMILAPDERQAAIWADDLQATMKPGAALAFAHGLNIHFRLIEPRPDLDVIMIAPKGPGRALRSEYLAGRGLACLIAVDRDATGNAHPLALAYAAAIGGGRAAIIETSFREECETDLFGEQAVLCGGLSHLVLAGFETLVEAGYAPEMAYFECLHEVKLVVDLMHEGGIAHMRRAISNTAEYGDVTTGPRLVTDETRREMKRVLDDIQAGRFVSRLVADDRAGSPELKAARERAAAHPIEKVGTEIRALMPWIGAGEAADPGRS